MGRTSWSCYSPGSTSVLSSCLVPLFSPVNYRMHRDCPQTSSLYLKSWNWPRWCQDAHLRLESSTYQKTKRTRAVKVLRLLKTKKLNYKNQASALLMHARNYRKQQDHISHHSQRQKARIKYSQSINYRPNAHPLLFILLKRQK